MNNHAVYLKSNHVTSVLYANLDEQTADNEVERINDGLAQAGIPGHIASAWTEQHHPDAVFVIG